MTAEIDTVFAEAFPFHLIITSSLTLHDFGSGLRRIDPSLRPGHHLTDHFMLMHPEVALCWRLLVDSHEKIFELVHRRTGLELRGRLVVPDANGPAIFHGTSWLNDPVSLMEFGKQPDEKGVADTTQNTDENPDQDTIRSNAARRDRDRLQRLACELSAIFQLSGDGFVAFNEHDIRSYVNPAFLRMTGFTRDELEGINEEELEKRLAPLLDPEHPTCPAPNDSEILTLRQPKRTIVQRSRREARDIDGRLFGRILYFRDVTLETDLLRMNSEFLANAAHELRTPMASIQGFAELLLRREFDTDTRRNVLETMHRQATRLGELINELLEVARFDARGDRDWNRISQPLAPIAQAAIDDLFVHDDSRQITTRLPSETESPRAQVDRNKVTQAITNLLTNAIKYSPGGGAITVSLCQHKDNEIAWVGISVTDQGIGMNDEQRSRVFDRFYRANPSGNIPGTGLGMAMVKKIMDLHEGKTEITSTPGEGTTVTLWWRESFD